MSCKHQHDEIELEPRRRLQFLRVHHEPAVAADRKDAAGRIEHGGHDRRGQARAHRGERVVEQEGVRDMGAVVARKPDLVHAVVETDDAVFGHRLPHVVNDPLRRQRVAAFLRAIGDMGKDPFA